MNTAVFWTKGSWGWGIIISVPWHDSVAHPFSAAGDRREQESKMEGVQPPSLLLLLLYIHKQICLWLVCACYVLLALSSGAQRSRISVISAVFYTGSNQLQWFTIAQPLNVHRAVRKIDLSTSNFTMSFCSGIAAQWLPGAHQVAPSSPPSLLLSRTGKKMRWITHGLR